MNGLSRLYLHIYACMYVHTDTYINNNKKEVLNVNLRENEGGDMGFWRQGAWEKLHVEKGEM